MKYFTKFIVTEGKVREGYCLDTNSGEVIYYNGDYGDQTPKNLKPVKLSLCSRDVKTGDLFYSRDGRIHECRNIFDHMPAKIEDYDGLSHFSENCYKVIGTIHHECSWVKEGIEIDEKDVSEILIQYIWDIDSLDNVQSFIDKSHGGKKYVINQSYKAYDFPVDFEFNVHSGVFKIRCYCCNRF